MDCGRCRCVTVVAAWLGTCIIAAAAEPFPPEGLPGQSLNAPIEGYEPSGLVWHTRLKGLFAVSDGGPVPARVFSLTDAGTDLQFWDIAADLEGITVADPATDFVNLGTEQPNQIKEFNFATGLVTRTFDLDPWMTGAPRNGLEALTFVTDAEHPEGGSSTPACRTAA